MKTANSILAILTLVFISACSANGTPQPTQTPVDINAVQTAAVQTVVADITQTAAAQPTQAPTETPVPPQAQATAAATSAPVASATSATPKAALCDNSVFLSDASVADGTQMTAGQNFIKSWRVKNTGSCTWQTNYKLIYAYGEKMSGTSTPLTAAILPGTEVEISVNLVAPLKTGNYGGYWRLANNNGVPFGQIFTVLITVP